MGLTSEEHTVQLKSIPTMSNTFKRSRDETATEYKSDTNDTTFYKLRSVEFRLASYSPAIDTTLHSSSSLNSTSTSSSSTTTIPTILHGLPFDVTSPNHNPIINKKLAKFQKNYK